MICGEKKKARPAHRFFVTTNCAQDDTDARTRLGTLRVVYYYYRRAYSVRAHYYTHAHARTILVYGRARI